MQSMVLALALCLPQPLMARPIACTTCCSVRLGACERLEPLLSALYTPVYKLALSGQYRHLDTRNCHLRV